MKGAALDVRLHESSQPTYSMRGHSLLNLPGQTIRCQQVNAAVAKGDHARLLPLSEDSIDALPGNAEHLGETFL